MTITHQWLRQQQRLISQLCQPAIVVHARVLQAQIEVPLRPFVYKQPDAKFLGEPPELAQRCSSLVKINKVYLHTPLGKKALRLSRVGTLLRAEDLHFHPH